jgi:hypothetical protein
VSGQHGALERLPGEILDVRAPSDRVSGAPGTMRIEDRACSAMPAAALRSRIVDTAVQEWAYFGFTLLDYTVATEPDTRSAGNRRRWSLLSPEQAGRVANSIAGYWAAAPDSSWILQRQNERWNTLGLAARWRDPWSAAFISWVMCESGLGDTEHFARAIAHHTYIDQAIRARDGESSGAAYVAYDTGEQSVLPGDLLCRGSRPAYRSLDERRDHLGAGARTHCDIVVKVDEDKPGFYVIGGNVRGTVGMKLLPAARTAAGFLQPLPYDRRQIFAHLQLQADPIPLDALAASPVMQAAGCSLATTPPLIVRQDAPRETSSTAC